MYIRTEIKEADIEAAEEILRECGVSEPDVTLQKIGYVLLDEELYPES